MSIEPVVPITSSETVMLSADSRIDVRAVPEPTPPMLITLVPVAVRRLGVMIQPGHCGEPRTADAQGGVQSFNDITAPASFARSR